MPQPAPGLFGCRAQRVPLSHSSKRDPSRDRQLFWVAPFSRKAANQADMALSQTWWGDSLNWVSVCSLYRRAVATKSAQVFSSGTSSFGIMKADVELTNK